MECNKEDDEKAERNIVENIKQYGYSICLFEESDYLPSFAYSIGFYETYGQPEIICFGLSLDLMSSMIHTAHRKITNSEKFKPGKQYPDFLQDYDITCLKVTDTHKRDWFGYANWYYGSWDFDCMQVVWPDKSYKFPWENDFNENWLYKQFLLDRNETFKFREPKNLGVLASTDFMQKIKPVTVVVHDNEGEWLFLTEDALTPSACGVYCLEEVIKKDPTLNSLFNIGYGKKAIRKNPGDRWAVVSFEYEKDDEEE